MCTHAIPVHLLSSCLVVLPPVSPFSVFLSPCGSIAFFNVMFAFLSLCVCVSVAGFCFAVTGRSSILYVSV